jgi:hypothetical protein
LKVLVIIWTLSQSSIDISKLIDEQRESVSSIRIKAFRASSDMISCLRFQEGHLDVLRSFGFKVSSTKEDWMLSDDTFVILVESMDSSRVYGGARLEYCNRGRDVPIQAALMDLAPEINNFIRNQSNHSTVELCGLWNSVSVAGMGIGSVYSIRAALAVAGLLNIQNILALCSVHSYRMASVFGFTLLKEVGEGGVVYYEGAKQNAHITYHEDFIKMRNVNADERDKIVSLINQPFQVVIEERNGTNLNITYDLQID